MIGCGNLDSSKATDGWKGFCFAVRHLDPLRDGPKQGLNRLLPMGGSRPYEPCGGRLWICGMVTRCPIRYS